DRNLVLEGVGINRRPRLDGLAINNQNFPLFAPARLIVSGIDISSGVMYRTVALAPRDLTLSFSQCSLDNGLQAQILDADDIALLAFKNCFMGSTSIATADHVSMDADTVAGAVSWRLVGYNSLSITHCWFRGGTGAA